MTNRESCTHHFEHVKQTRPFTEREYVECTKCGYQNPLGLFQTVDFERDGPMTTFRDNGFELPIGPPRIDFARNSYVYKYDPKVMPKKSIIDVLIDAFKPVFKPKPKRQPITKVRRISRRPNPITGRTFSTWYWQCALCDHNMKPRETGGTNYGELCLTWEQAHRRADRHARNHHGR